MKTNSRKPRTRLARMVRGLAVFLTLVTLQAQSLTLKDSRGRAIEMRPISATDTEIVGIRASDRKEVKIPFATLDIESQKRVTEWKRLTGRMPKKEFAMKFSSTGERSKDYTVKFKAPEGTYNTSIHNSVVGYNKITLTFEMPIPDKEPEKGTFSITVTVVNGKQTNKPTEAALNEILQQFNKNLGFVLDRMTPGERKSNEPIMKVEALSHGEFKGYRAPSNQSEKFRSRTTNGRFLIDSRLSHSELPNQIDLPITPEDVPRILETLEVVEGH